MPTAEMIDVTVRDGTRFRIRRQGRGPAVMFSHGAGFAVDAYAPFIAELVDHFEVFAVDLRGHGRGPAVSPDNYQLDTHIDDIADIAAALTAENGGAPLYGLFHSISGVFALAAERQTKSSFRGLVLYEPPLGEDGPGDRNFVADKMARAERTRRRRSQFDSIEALAERFAPLLSSADHALALAKGLLKKTDNGYELRCAPAIESMTYAGNHNFGLWADLADLQCGGLIMAGRPAYEMEYPGTVATRIAAAAGFDYLRLPQLGHLGFMEAPARTVRFARAALDSF